MEERAITPGECWIPDPLPPPSSIGPTFSDPHSAPEIPRNCAARRTDLLTGRSPISVLYVLSPAIFSEPVDWTWSVPVSKVEADHELVVRSMGDGLEDRWSVRKSLSSNTNCLLIGAFWRLPAERPVGPASVWFMSAILKADLRNAAPLASLKTISRVSCPRSDARWPPAPSV
ncbi:MAG: hypothetical protein K0S42_2771 [Microvirga sp.]|nr:hypothetical protein [Microvirga sp.]